MSRAIWIVAAAALGFPAMGCGDSHTADDAGGITFMDGGGGTDGGGGSTDGGGGGTDGGGGGTDSGVTGDDAGVVVLDGGGPRDGGGTVGIDCMGMTCDATTQQCCVTMAPGGGVMAACIARDATCMGAVADCDGPEDCGSGEVCCARVGLGGATTTCEAAAMCTPGSFGPFELCHAGTDCTDGTNMCCPIMRFGFSGAYCSAMCYGGPPPPPP